MFFKNNHVLESVKNKKNASFDVIVFEAISEKDKNLVKKYIREKKDIYIVEPFIAFHKSVKSKSWKIHHGFSDELPLFINNYINKKEIKLIKNESFDAKNIYNIAGEKAVNNIERLYPFYKKKNSRVISNLLRITQMEALDYAFRKIICENLAEFYSLEILLERIMQLFKDKKILLYTNYDINNFTQNNSIINSKNIGKYDSVQLVSRLSYFHLIEKCKKNIFALLIIIAKIFCAFISCLNGANKEKKIKCKYAITILSTIRQLVNNSRGPNFLIDNVTVKKEDVIYISLIMLNKAQKQKADEHGSRVLHSINKLKYNGFVILWIKYFLQSLIVIVKKENYLLFESTNILLYYLRWKKILSRYDINHFITHCDFSYTSIARNVALNQSGVKTWYFIDSVNSGCVWLGESGVGVKHPFWTYLNYNNLVTWDAHNGNYYKSHPTLIDKIHVVGCIWAGMILKCKQKNTNFENLFESSKNKVFRIGVFDSGYSRNGIFTYKEGIQFAKDIYTIVQEYENVRVVFKEKTFRSHRVKLDTILGPELVIVYEEMAKHPRIKFLSNDSDTESIIVMSDLVISFPFTSTTYEALSINKPALWHFPGNSCFNSQYEKLEGIVTHSLNDLKSIIDKCINQKIDYKNILSKSNSEVIDPYRDGYAIDRFRELLLSECNS